MYSVDRMSSFAWGLAPSSARAQVVLAELGGCTLPDTTWRHRVRGVVSDPADHPDDRTIVAACTTPVKTSLVPKLLLRELLVQVAHHLLGDNETILTVPRVTIHRSLVGVDRPTLVWLVTLTACFPCDGTPVVRCVAMTALLDAVQVERSRVLSAQDAGVVPAEESISFGVLPFNARTTEFNPLPS